MLGMAFSPLDGQILVTWTFNYRYLQWLLIQKQTRKTGEG